MRLRADPGSLFLGVNRALNPFDSAGCTVRCARDRRTAPQPARRKHSWQRRELEGDVTHPPTFSLYRPHPFNRPPPPSPRPSRLLHSLDPPLPAHFLDVMKSFLEPTLLATTTSLLARIPVQ